MELKYVGPKPIISHTGIEFDNNKEDKYAYLNIVVQLLKALDHDYFEDKTYIYNTQTTRISNDMLMKELSVYCEDLNAIIEKERKIIEKEVYHDIQRAKENSVLNDENKEVLVNNIKIMHEYLVQRAINKSVYYCAIDKLAELLKKDHIDHIIVPMYQTYEHVLRSVQGSLLKQKFPIDTKIEIYKDGDKLLVKLQVINIT